MSFNLAHLNWIWNRILKGDSQGGFSRGILKGDSQESDFWSSKSWESRISSLGNPGIDKISTKPSFGCQKVMNLGIQKRRGTQLRAGWSDSQPVSSVLRSIYAKSVGM